MARKPNPELEQLRAFCLHVLDFEAERTGRTLGVFAQMRESIAWWPRVDGMRMATSDLIEMLRELKGADLDALDRRLSAAGLPTMAAMRNTETRRVVGILARGRIRNDEEFYLVNARLSDMADTPLSEAEREVANRAVAQYEDRTRNERAK